IAELQACEAAQVDRRQAGADQLPRFADVADLDAGNSLHDRGSALVDSDRISGRAHEDNFSAGITGHPGKIFGVGYEKGVARRRRKLAHDADEVEWDDVILVIGG